MLILLRISKRSTRVCRPAVWGEESGKHIRVRESVPMLCRGPRATLRCAALCCAVPCCAVLGTGVGRAFFVFCFLRSPACTCCIVGGRGKYTAVIGWVTSSYRLDVFFLCVKHEEPHVLLHVCVQASVCCGSGGVLVGIQPISSRVCL